MKHPVPDRVKPSFIIVFDICAENYVTELKMINSRITYNTYTCQRDFETRLLVVCVNVGENGGLQCYSYGHAVKNVALQNLQCVGWNGMREGLLTLKTHWSAARQ